MTEPTALLACHVDGECCGCCGVTLTREPGLRAALDVAAHWKARAEALVMALERADDRLNMRGDPIAAHIYMVEAIEADDRAALALALEDRS